MACVVMVKWFFSFAFFARGSIPVVGQAKEDVIHQIQSIQYGYVTHYSSNEDLLQFSKAGKAANFTFTSKNALRLVDKTTTTTKCVTRKTNDDKQLVLTGNCILDQWVYNSTSRHLQDITDPDRGCFSPWDLSNKAPPDLNITTGLSPCSKWNEIILEAVGKQETPTRNYSEHSLNVGAIGVGVTGGILFFAIAATVIFFVRRMKKRKRDERAEIHQMNDVSNPNQMPLAEPSSRDCLWKTSSISDNSVESPELSYVEVLEDWDISPDQLKLLDKKLGGGQFGIVKQGLLTTRDCESEVVAVKTVKEYATESDMQDLKEELVLLRKVNRKPHPNVLRLIGSCSIKGNLHVITEFCCGGNLRQFLIKSRVQSSKETSNVTSTLNSFELLKIAVDVANGMVHLVSQKLVHRDLAARNILIGENYTAKISDFGLARDIKGAEEYLKNNQNLLPIKWMALESLLHGRFTTASDVWSYGVLLYEIMTLGEEPYKNISPNVIVAHLGSGCRMSKPAQCSDRVYAIMTKCWKFEPKERPAFEEIRESLNNILNDKEYDQTMTAPVHIET